MLSSDARKIGLAKELRGEMSLPEVLVWRVLKTKPNGLKFRRQHAAGRYILDFYCHAASLCVEVDGDHHGLGDRPERDAGRDAWLAAQGIVTLRLTATDVLTNLDGVIEAILQAAPPPHASP